MAEEAAALRIRADLRQDCAFVDVEHPIVGFVPPITTVNDHGRTGLADDDAFGRHLPGKVLRDRLGGPAAIKRDVTA